MDLLSAGPLSAEQAWLLLMAALGDSGDLEVARRRFRTAATPDAAKDATTVEHAEGSR